MKPAEILGMLEETAGTKMYETKKLQSEKLIDKKELKVKEISDILQKEIQPTLEKLATERLLSSTCLCSEIRRKFNVDAQLQDLPWTRSGPVLRENVGMTCAC